MGLLDNTAIIFTSDHGFEFGERGVFGKQNFGKHEDMPCPRFIFEGAWDWQRYPFYEEVDHVPLMIYVPRVKPGVQKGLTSAVDITPTVLDLMDVKIPDYVQGQSLVPMVHDKSARGREFTVSGEYLMVPNGESRIFGRLKKPTGSDTTITTDEWTLLYSPGDKSLLYHLPSDPGQEKNVADEHPEVVKELHQMFARHINKTSVNPEVREELLQLRW